MSEKFVFFLHNYPHLVKFFPPKRNPNKNKSIICFDLFRESIIAELKYCHDENITNFKHYLDEINKRDLVMSLSRNDNNIKIWNIANFECLLNIKTINEQMEKSVCKIKCSDGTSIGLLKINGNDISQLIKLGINLNDYAANSDKTISIYPNLKDNIQLIIIGNPIMKNSREKSVIKTGIRESFYDRKGHHGCYDSCLCHSCWH